MENASANPVLESEYNGIATDQTSPTPTLPQEVNVIDSSSNEEGEQANAQGHNANVYMEDAQGLNNSNEEELPESDHEDMLVDGILQPFGGIEINFNNIYAELMEVDEIIRMLNEGLNPLEIEQAIRIDSYKEMEGDHKECTVCLEYLHDGEVVANLRCSHLFHPLCITNWLEIKNRCPNCRVAALHIDD